MEATDRHEPGPHAQRVCAVGEGRSGGVVADRNGQPVLLQRSMVDGVPDEGILPCGQVAAAIGELKSCQALIEDMVQEAERCLRAVAARHAV